MPGNADVFIVDDLYEDDTDMTEVERDIKKQKYKAKLAQFWSNQPSMEDLLEIAKKEENKL